MIVVKKLIALLIVAGLLTLTLGCPGPAPSSKPASGGPPTTNK